LFGSFSFYAIPHIVRQRVGRPDYQGIRHPSNKETRPEENYQEREAKADMQKTHGFLSMKEIF
jgi:hypothetical protein